MNNSKHILQILMSLLVEVTVPNNQKTKITTTDEISDKLIGAGLNKKELMFVLIAHQK